MAWNSIRTISVLFLLSLGVYQCKAPTSEVDLKFTELLVNLLGQESFFFVGEIDMDNTPDCGIATPDATGGGTQPGTGPGGVPSVRNTGNGSQQNTRYSIISTFIMKETREVLNLRFNYDQRQLRGSLNPQQGFVLSGGQFGNTVTGRLGTVEWGNLGIQLNPSTQGNQQIPSMIVKLALQGTYVPGQGTNIQPNQCFTLDNVNCTTQQTGSQCFTVDNRTCLADPSGSPNARSIGISGEIRCFAPTVLN